ncbi:MAG: ribulose-phosphate 3-epimerase [Clostridia bacterium]|nr:ribulose-phosphate 3-epimerase [Clostridia bacterium]
MIKILPSILAADILRMGEEIARMMEAGADGLHVDIMDAHFVPNLSFAPAMVKAIRKAFPDIYQDVHLMMDNPAAYISAFAEAGADAITVHAEIPEDIEAVLRDIRARGCRAGLSVKPKTDVRAIEKYLPLCDQVLVMTVEPGFGGQKFMADMMPKLRWLREQGFAGGVQVDGGVNAETARECVAAGADELVMGTALVRSADPVAVIRACRDLEARP